MERDCVFLSKPPGSTRNAISCVNAVSTVAIILGPGNHGWAISVHKARGCPMTRRNAGGSPFPPEQPGEANRWDQPWIARDKQ